jgi:hypothetical protein
VSLSPEERNRLVAAQRVLSRAVSIADAPSSIEQLQAERFASLGVDPRDGEALSLADARRILVYRNLVRGTLHDTIALELERTVARMPPGSFDRTIAAFCLHELPRSQILRDAAFELAAWATPRWHEDETLPAYLGDLARYELLEFDVYCARRQLEEDGWQPPAEPQELDAAQSVHFDETVRVARFDYAVHLLPTDVADRSQPELRTVTLLAYCDHEGEMRQLELTEVAATILTLLRLGGTSLGQALQVAARRHDTPIDQRLIDGTAQVLADLAERGAVLGPRPTGPPQPPSPFATWLYGPLLAAVLAEDASRPEPT